MAPNLATDGVDVLWDFSRTSEGQGLMDGANGQLVVPSKVVIDPYRAFGQPFFENSRTRVWDVANMLKAGENPRSTDALEPGLTTITKRGRPSDGTGARIRR